MKILITGISGFLGRNLLKYLKDNNELYGLDMEESMIDQVKVYSSTKIMDIDITPDVVIICHGAVAYSNVVIPNKTLFFSNVDLTEKILMKFNNSFFIYVSTASIYLKNNELITERSYINPQSQYATSKFWAEQLVLSNSYSSVIRLSSIYGIGMKENTLIPNYINQALKNHRMEVWGNGSRLQNYIHVIDVAKYIERIFLKPQACIGKVLLGVSNREYSNLDVSMIVGGLIDSEIKFVNQDDSISLRYNNEYTRNILGLRDGTTIENGIEEYVSWKRKQF